MDDESAEESIPNRNADERIPLDLLPLHSTNLLTVLDENGIIQYESPAVEHIYGYDQAELVGEQVAEYVHPDDREQTVGAFERVVASEEYTVESVEFRHRQADGTYKWVESVASANPTPEGYYVVNTRDISDRKRREQRLERTNERLEEFASVLSHDLRNPLTVAQLRVQLAMDESGSEHLAIAADAHSRMEALIEDILADSRYGSQSGELESVSLESLVGACWRSVSRTDAELVVDSDCQVRADRGRLRQLVENLVRNALEHAGESVTVTVGSLETGFYFEDDGPGIPADQREHVFEAGNSRLVEGTGLGLHIAERVVETHGWQIRVVDGTEGGARFEITGVEISNGD